MKRKDSHVLAVPVPDPPFFSVWYGPEILPFEQYLACTPTATASAVLIVEAENKTICLQIVVVWRLLHRGDGFVSLRVERLHVVVLQFDLQNLIEVQDRFRVADLEVLIDHQCEAPSRGKACFFLCRFFNKDTSFAVSVDDLLEPTRYLEPRSWSKIPSR